MLRTLCLCLFCLYSSVIFQCTANKWRRKTGRHGPIKHQNKYTTACHATTECTSAFYNHVTGTCYGCNGYYDVDTTIVIDESDTTYHYIACPEGWTRRGNSCYQLSQDQLDWWGAKNSCLAQNAYLFETNDEEENNFMQAMNTHGQDLWLGLNEISVDNEYRWTGSNALATYTRWEHGEPNGFFVTINCAHAYPNGRWNDDACSGGPRYYVCEKAVKN